MTSWPALAGAAVFATFSVRSWVQVVRHWDGPATPSSPMALARYFGPDAQRRLEHASALNAACLSGLALLLLGGAWLPPAGSTTKENPVALGVAAFGLAVFLAGFLAQLSIGFFGGPRFLLPRHFRGAKSDVSAASVSVPGRAVDATETSTDRDEAES